MTKVIDGQLHAYNDHDLDKLMTYYAPNAVLAGYPDGKVAATGHEEIRAVFKQLFDTSPSIRARSLGRIISGEFVIEYEYVSGIAGPVTELRGVVIYRVKDGKIEHGWSLPPEVAEAQAD
jgi:hypothetical protein